MMITHYAARIFATQDGGVATNVTPTHVAM